MVAVKARTSRDDRPVEGRPEAANLRVLAQSLARSLDSLNVTDRVTHASRAVRSEIVFCDAKVAQANRQIGRLWSTSNFEVGWDGVDAVPPSSESLRAAQEFISRVTHSSIPVPMASVGCDGQSNLFWDDGDFVADVDIVGRTVTYTIDHNGLDQSFEEPLIDGYIPPRLLRTLLERYER